MKADRSVRLACGLLVEVEGEKEWAYPDPCSALAIQTRKLRLPWGSENALTILSRLPSSLAALPGAPWTIGVGMTGGGIKAGLRWSREVSQANLEGRVEQDREDVGDSIQMPTEPWELAGLLSFVFNVGVRAFKTSTLLRLFNRGDKPGCANQFIDPATGDSPWDNAGGVKNIPGLRNRRRQERAMFLGTHPLIARVL